MWVADFNNVSTWSGWVYVAFVIDAYSRRILGWRTALTMTTPLVLDATSTRSGPAAEKKLRICRGSFTTTTADHNIRHCVH
ncbi:hypothetical protein G8767_10390 [Rhodococcus sp. IC4_135]|nr:hypothetical protein [Rhodococcus sp. IC4_135]